MGDNSYIKKIDRIVKSSKTMWYDFAGFHGMEEIVVDESDGTIKKQYPGFLLIHCDKTIDVNRLVDELNEILETMNKSLDKDFSEKWADSKYHEFRSFKLLGIVENKKETRIYYVMNGGVSVESGSGDICQEFMDIGSYIRREFTEVFSRTEYNNLKYEGYINVGVNDNYWDDTYVTGITNMHEYKTPEIKYTCAYCFKVFKDSEGFYYSKLMTDDDYNFWGVCSKKCANEIANGSFSDKNDLVGCKRLMQQELYDNCVLDELK